MKVLTGDGTLLDVPDEMADYDSWPKFQEHGWTVLPEGTEVIPLPGDQRTIWQRLVDLKRDLPGIPKADVNDEQQFNFRGMERIMAVTAPLLARHGIVAVPHVRSVERWITERGKFNTPWEHFLVRVRYRFHGALGDYAEARVFGEGLDNADKGMAKAMTVAYKTALLEVLSIHDAEVPDPDGETPDGPSPRRQPAKRASKATKATKKAAAPKLTWDESLTQNHGAEFAAHVIGVVERINGIEDEATRERIRADLKAEFGHPGNVTPDTLAAFLAWGALVLDTPPDAPTEGDGDPAQQTDTQDPVTGDQGTTDQAPDPTKCGVCGAPAKEDTPGWCGEHEPFN